MRWTLQQFAEAVRLLTALEPDLMAAVGLSVLLATISTALATAVGLPVGLALGLARFRGKRLVTTVLHASMAVPTVLVGLVLYTVLSRRGVLGGWGLLYTPAAIVMGQTVLATPLVTALAHAAAGSLDPRIRRTVQTLGAGRWRTATAVLAEGRRAFLAAVVAGFGRVFGEVGVSMMLGGNIRGYTRTVTTAIALETARGEVALGIALGIVLVVVALGMNLVLVWLRGGGEPR